MKETDNRERTGEARRTETYLCALQSCSIRMSSSDDSAAAGAAAEAEHIPRPRRARAAASRRASAVAMPASPNQARAWCLGKWDGRSARCWSRARFTEAVSSPAHGRWCRTKAEEVACWDAHATERGCSRQLKLKDGRERRGDLIRLPTIPTIGESGNEQRQREPCGTLGSVRGARAISSLLFPQVTTRIRIKKKKRVTTRIVTARQLCNAQPDAWHRTDCTIP